MRLPKAKTATMTTTEEQRERNRAACRRWRAANPDKQRASTKRWELANAGYIKEKRRTYCAENREQRTALRREWGRKNPGQHLKKYGITLEDFIRMAVVQNGQCAICKTSTKLCVDHCHESGQVRGLLCRKCNSAIGLLQESVEVAARASQYLREVSFVQG